MTLAERGAYVHLLCLNWQEGRLPKDPKKLARLLDCSLQEFQQIWEGIRHQFKEDSQGGIYNQQVEAIKKRHLERRRKLAMAGSKDGRLKPNGSGAQAKLQAGLQARLKQPKSSKS